jgi:1-acyl-sn-glycerol-3-phosphate acyltransferase
MKKTIFTAPLTGTYFHYVAKFWFRVAGWRVVGQLPDLPKMVIVGAPHTSNWDFMLFLGLVFTLREDVRYMGKAELFRSPLGGFFRWCGGYPVDRKNPQGLVEQMVKAFEDNEKFQLVITPEGTRHKVRSWKTGFYRIAKGAGVPIVLAYVDGARKTVGIGPTMILTNEMDKDIKSIQSFYAGYVGVNPHMTSELSVEE